MSVVKKYIVGILYYGGRDSEHAKCMEGLKDHPYIAQVVSLEGCPYIDIGRCALAAHAIELDAGGILFIDHDIIFDIEEVTRIIESAESTKGVVGAGYSMRRPGLGMIGGIDVEKSIEQGLGDIIFFEGGKLYPALYLGMGFTAIHRDALETIGKELPKLKSGITDIEMKPLFSLLQEDGKYYGEDVSFCIRAGRAGVTMHMDTRIRVHHKGTYTYGLEDCGIVVPYLHSLKGLLKSEIAAKYTNATPHPEIAELTTEKPLVYDSGEPLSAPKPSGLGRPAPAYPESHDPTAAPSATPAAV